MDWEGVLNKFTCTQRAHLLFWCPEEGGGGGNPTYELDSYHQMSRLIATAFEGLHP